MRIDTKELERLGGTARNPDIAAALRLLDLSGVLIRCEAGYECACGGDTDAVRATCPNFVKL